MILPFKRTCLFHQAAEDNAGAVQQEDGLPQRHQEASDGTPSFAGNGSEEELAAVLRGP